MKTKISEKIILGVDPGTRVLGYGIIGVDGSKIRIIQYGVIRLEKYNTHELKLKKIFERITQLIIDYQPGEMAIEAPFYGENVQSMLKLGRAQGVAMAAALAKDLNIVEYLPKKVKQSVTGNGNASKDQVAYMLEKLFNQTLDKKFLDATDGLAVAVCHFMHGKTKAITDNTSKKSGWSAFLAENPERLK